MNPPDVFGRISFVGINAVNRSGMTPGRLYVKSYWATRNGAPVLLHLKQLRKKLLGHRELETSLFSALLEPIEVRQGHLTNPLPFASPLATAAVGDILRELIRPFLDLTAALTFAHVKTAVMRVRTVEPHNGEVAYLLSNVERAFGCHIAKIKTTQTLQVANAL